MVNMPVFIKALDELDLDTKVLFELACFCGLRRSETLGLELNHIKKQLCYYRTISALYRLKNRNKTAENKAIRKSPCFTQLLTK
jgi:integrase